MDTVRIDSLALFSRLASNEPVVVLDVRREPAFQEDGRMLMRAPRPTGDLVRFARTHAPGREIVVYCVKGHEVGCDAAAALRDAGLSGEQEVHRWNP